MKSIFIPFIIVLIIGCSRSNRKYVNISRVINQQDLADTLILEEKSRLRIYSTGELSPEWANIDREYLGQDDDIEIFFRSIDNSLKKIVFRESLKRSDTLNITTDQVRCIQYYDKLGRKFIAQITIPKKILLIKGSKKNSIEFDLAIGDNDDGIRQKSKLAWASILDPLKESIIHGKLLLLDTPLSFDYKNVLGITKNLSASIDWSMPSRANIKNLVYGEINDDADLSANFKGTWNEKYITLRIEINDSKEGKFKREKLLQDDNFVDKGWIEDFKGKKIWKMDLLNSKYGGGARKNQYCDTLLVLPQGKYVVKYTSDESHSFRTWDSPEPNKNFWGIQISTE